MPFVVKELRFNVFVLRLARPSQVSFGGAVKGESAMKSKDDIGTLVELCDLWFKMLLFPGDYRNSICLSPERTHRIYSISFSFNTPDSSIFYYSKSSP